VTAAELRVLEARMDTLNAMLQDLVHQARRIQASTSTDQRQQAETDLSGPAIVSEFTGVASTRSKIIPFWTRWPRLCHALGQLAPV